MNIGILGLGAIGTLMAWHWRAHNLYGIQQQHSRSIDRQFLDAQQHKHSLSLTAWQQQPLDWLVITTKAADTLPALQAQANRLSNVQRILLLQNGMGQQQVADWLVTQELNRIKLWAGISTEGAYRQPSGVVVHAGQGNNHIGPWPNAQPDYPDAGDLPPKTEFQVDIEQIIKEKLAINAVINPLTAVLKCKNGELVSQPEYYSRLLTLTEEISQLYQALGWALPFDLLDKVKSIALMTADNQSSTLQDVLKNRTTELTYINVFLLEKAQEKKVSMPENISLLQQLREI